MKYNGSRYGNDAVKNTKENGLEKSEPETAEAFQLVLFST
jgi:hypothetical protein